MIKKPSKYGKKKLRIAVKLCSKYWGVDPDMLLKKDRSRTLMNFKHSVRYFLYKGNDMTFGEIGYLTGCDHSNAIHSKNTFLTLAEVDPKFKRLKEKIEGEQYTLVMNNLESFTADVINMDCPEMTKTQMICNYVKTQIPYEVR